MIMSTKVTKYDDMTITETEEATTFSFHENKCPANKDGYGHDWRASRPTIKDGPTEDGDWEVVFSLRCSLCDCTGTSEVSASDGFIKCDTKN
jgi:hypothetical protein